MPNHCPGCTGWSKPLSWARPDPNIPPCPGCGHESDLEQLRADLAVAKRLLDEGEARENAMVEDIHKLIRVSKVERNVINWQVEGRSIGLRVDELRDALSDLDDVDHKKPINQR